MLAVGRISLVIIVLSSALLAQSDTENPQEAQARIGRLAFAVAPSDVVTFKYANRPITVLRAQILSYTPAIRAQSAKTIVDELVDRGITGPVTTRPVSGVVFLRVGDRDVLNLVPPDVDELSGETLQQKADDAAAHLRVALSEAVELRTPSRLLRQGALFLAATLLLFLLLTGLWRVHPRVHGALTKTAGEAFSRVLPGPLATEQVAIAARRVRGLVTTATLGLTGILCYWWLAFSLRQFPYTRPWGETLRKQLLAMLAVVGGNVANALPGLFIVFLVIASTRILVRISNAFFNSVEREHLEVAWAYPETASATRRLVAIVLWLFALIVAYPFLPGSGSLAFKGVSVFVGLVAALGSSGLVNQLMSGLTLTYSRALKLGDIVCVGDQEGLVTALSMLSLKLRTFTGEEVTIPNSVVVSQSTINYTRLAPAGGAYLSAHVTIGYDTPWRQVSGLLTLAAERTSNIRRDPEPWVFREGLDDFYVRYRLVVCVENAGERLITRDALHVNILDAFNEFGVQIMSPHYRMDPEGRKVVPRGRWFDPPGASTLDRGAA